MLEVDESYNPTDPDNTVRPRHVVYAPRYGQLTLTGEILNGSATLSAVAAALALSTAACAVRPVATDPLTLDTHIDIPRTYMREARFDAGTDTACGSILARWSAAASMPRFS